MTGSQAPQRALRRLARLGLRTDRLAALTAPAALLDDPLAGLTARPLDESALEAVLRRLEGSATITAGTASSSAAARFRNMSAMRKGGRAGRASNALASRLGTGGLPPAAGHEPLATRSSSHARRIRPAAPTAHEPNGSSPAPAPAAAGRRESSPLARAAGRVPGGAAAASTRVAAAWTPDELTAAGVLDGPALLEAALARAEAQRVDAGEPSHGRRVRRSEPAGSFTPRPSVEDALAPRAGGGQVQAEPVRRRFARLGDEQPTRLAGAAEHGEPDSASQLPGSGSGGLVELVRGSFTSRPSLEGALAPHAGGGQAEPARRRFARLGDEQPTRLAGAAEHGEPDDALQLPGSGSGGLAELVRRWESVHGRHDEPPAVRHEGEADAGGGIEAEEALARALERVLAAELRRSGIEVDAG